VVKARDGAHAVVELAEAVDRDGDADREVRRDRADPVDHRPDLGRGETVRRDTHVEDVTPLDVDADDLGKVAPEKRLAARDQQPTARGAAGGETVRPHTG